jgi:hypothetical protein
MSSISQILKNQLVVMEALSQLLPSKNLVQPMITEAASESARELSSHSFTIGGQGFATTDELEKLLNSESDVPVKVNPNGSVTVDRSAQVTNSSYSLDENEGSWNGGRIHGRR